jgi:hypothetical protein
MTTYLNKLAAHSRIWVFQADRFLTESEVQKATAVLTEFIPQWASHGNELYGDFQVESNLFILIGVDETQSHASGCSIDSLTRVIKTIGADLNVDFFNRLAIAYQEKNGNIELVSMQTFKQLIADGSVSHDTIVFNNLVDSQAALNENWVTPVKKSWHTNLFELA